MTELEKLAQQIEDAISDLDIYWEIDDFVGAKCPDYNCNGSCEDGYHHTHGLGEPCPKCGKKMVEPSIILQESVIQTILAVLKRHGVPSEQPLGQ